MPEPESLVVEVRPTVPWTAKPRPFIVALGAVLSTVTVCAALVAAFPARSVVTARSWVEPSSPVVVSHVTWNGGGGTAAPRAEELESVGPLGWNWAGATPRAPPTPFGGN